MTNKALLLWLFGTILLAVAACSGQSNTSSVTQEAVSITAVASPVDATDHERTPLPLLTPTALPEQTAVPVQEESEELFLQIGEESAPDLVPQWEITPFRVGEAAVNNPDPGWRYVAIYYGIENRGVNLEYYLPAGYGPRWLEAIIPRWNWSNRLPPSDPALIHSYIQTAEGYRYEPKPSSLWHHMTIIEGDEPFFFADKRQRWDEISYAPNFMYFPPIPPGFRLFGSIEFKVAGNTTAHTWVIPGLGEFLLDDIGQDLSFPFDEAPSYVKQIGEDFVLEDGNSVTVSGFGRRLDGSAYILLDFHNPTGLDFDPSKFQLHLISDRGWLVPQRNYFACVPLFDICPHKPPKIGPGQQLTHPLPWQIPAEIGDMYLEVIYHESMGRDGHYNGGEWAVFMLPNNIAPTSSNAREDETIIEFNADEMFFPNMADVAVDRVAVNDEYVRLRMTITNTSQDHPLLLNSHLSRFQIYRADGVCCQTTLPAEHHDREIPSGDTLTIGVLLPRDGAMPPPIVVHSNEFEWNIEQVSDEARLQSLSLEFSYPYLVFPSGVILLTNSNFATGNFIHPPVE